MAQQKSNSKPVTFSFSQYVSVAEAALLLGTTRHTVYRRIRRGEIEHVEIGGFKVIARTEIARVKKAS